MLDPLLFLLPRFLTGIAGRIQVMFHVEYPVLANSVKLGYDTRGYQKRRSREHSKTVSQFSASERVKSYLFRVVYTDCPQTVSQTYDKGS